MKFTIERYILFCKDMQGVTAFYSDVLGLKPSIRTDTPASEWVELGTKAFRLALHKASNPGSKGSNRNKIVFRVDDVGAAREYLLDHGVRMGKHNHWAHADACDGKDPEGNVFQITGPKS
jgi:catechol 2,3-dioxygenase-like lactoylglutathione lyase family enzyme